MTHHGQTISHHLVRRRARGLKKKLEDAQKVVRVGMRSAGAGDNVLRARELLAKYDVTTSSTLRVESTVRGPFGWRVVVV